MSKSKTAPADRGAKGNKPNAILAHMAKLVKGKSIKMILALLLFGGGSAICYHYGWGWGYHTAALYLFANDGKISGRQSGSVKTRNGVERMFVVPRLVQNAYTSLQRTLFSTYSSAWASLTQEQRDTWSNVDNVFGSNRFGVQIPIKGKALFIQRNSNLTNAGASPLSAYVPSAGVAGSWLTDATVALTLGLITTAEIVFAPSPTDSTVTHLVYATASLPAGVSRPKASAYRLITTMPNSTATPFDVMTAYIAKFGNISTAGQKIGFKLTPIDTATGQAGVSSVFVTETV